MGCVREVVARVLVRFAFHAYAIHKATAVGVDQPAQEPLRLSLNKSLLPSRQPDRSEVLCSRAMLWEETRDLVRVDAKDHAMTVSSWPVACDAIPRKHALHRLCARDDDPRPSLVKRDPEAPGAGRPRDVAVAEVHAKQIDVACGGQVIEVVFWRCAAGTRRTTARSTGVRRTATPVTYRRSRYAAKAGDLAVVEAALGQVDHFAVLGIRPHQNAAGGTRTHKPLRTMPFESIAFA